jgi:murein DD-endopeptidase MepM/ murein hydrolase activator NlpD
MGPGGTAPGVRGWFRVPIEAVQQRISQIQAMMLAASPPPAPTSAGDATPVGGPAASGAAAVGGTGAAFASVLAQAVDTGSAPPAAGWVHPTRGTVSSEFGPRWGRQHEGIDFAAGTGTPVVAAADGVVRKAEWYGGYGNAVIIDHGGGVRTLYGHNSENTVQVGQRVRAGQTIGKVGSTGDSTGPHLHFEVQVDGKPVNPRPWLEQRGIKL